MSLTSAMSDVRQRLQYLEARPSRSRIAAYAIRRTNIQPRSVSTDQMDFQSATTEILADDAVTNDKIAVDSISTDQIQEGAVTNPELGGGQVDGRVIANDAIESRHIKNGEVKTDDIGGLQVTNEKLAGGIENAKLAGGITNDKLAGGITNDKLDGGITNDKLAGGITNEKLAGSISNDKLAGGITNDKLAGGITNDKLAGGITNAKLAGGITNDKLAGDIANNKLAGGITRNKLAFNTVVSVGAGTGLSGGGEVRNPSLSVNFSSVARASHTHSYAAVNHGHGNQFGATSSSILNASGPVPTHSHPFSINISSTRKLKKDISDHTFDHSKLLELDLKTFRYLNHAKNMKDNREWHFGYIAEDVYDLGLEELVGYNAEKEPVSINYAMVGVFALEIIKEQQKSIELLERKVSLLEAKVQ